MVEILVAMTVLAMLMTSVWSSFKTTIRGMETAESVQQRYSEVRNGLSRIDAELSMAYLSFNRPMYETRHFTMFEGRDSFSADSVTFSAFAHLRLRKDADESDQSIIQYFIEADRDDSSKRNLYRRESRRLTGDLPERMQEYAPAYVLIEDVDGFDVKYWDNVKRQWIDEWATMRTDMQPDRLPERVKIELTVRNKTGEATKFTTQTILFLQEKLDASRT